MPKTMTFERKEYELLRKLLTTELKRAQSRVDAIPSPIDYAGQDRFDKACAHRDMVADMLTEANKPVMVTRRNLMSGKEYQEAEDTPLGCSPASETYWSM
jgi:hypothetical protein